ncbi:mechanosensitive ion channel family protein [Oryzobacter telluris]|uniref:mechanosensitive ion channel family protein n=1 Tax=Oryzobacter telluris TaxID=3149179 RepID=UPI00370D95BC
MPVTEVHTALVPDLSLKGFVLTIEQVQEWLVTDGLRVLLTLVMAVLAVWALRRLIDRVVATMTSKSASRLAESGRAGKALATATGLATERQRQRVGTIGSLLRSTVTFTVGTMAGLTVMALLGIPLGPLLASAGVAGVAIGFGAQSLVKDFLAGIFMILEDQYGVGDVIDTGEAIGTVEEVTLRITRLRDADGVTWYVRNGEIIRIGNKSQGFSTALVDMPVSYAENAERVIAIIREVAVEMGADPEWADRLSEEPKVLGVESISGATMTIRTIAQCSPGENFAVQRELRERIKNALDAADVKAPPLGPFGGPVGSPPGGRP